MAKAQIISAAEAAALVKDGMTVMVGGFMANGTPEAIIDEIFTALQEVPAGKEVFRISDRREAIEYVLANAEADDVVMIAGKGHETYQVIGKERVHYDEREVVAEILGI